MNIYKLKVLYFKKILVTIVLAIIFLVKFLCSINYSKSVDLNGIKISLTTDVVKKIVVKGTNVVSNTHDSTENKERDEYVKVELSVRNNNPYESANITILEKVNRGFKQVESSELDKNISFKLDSNKEKSYKYNYKYSKHILLDQIESIIYGDSSVEDIENTNVQAEIGNLKGIDVNDKDSISFDISDKEKAAMDEKETKKDNIFKIVLIAFVVLILGFTVFMLFVTFIQGIRDNNIDFGDKGSFSIFVVLIASSFLLSLALNRYTYAANYIPIMYKKGEILTKNITEAVLFNDRYFEFSYEISVSFENKHEIANYDIDTDGDGLVDALEYLYMTDINNKDSDGDGLSDYIEVMLLNYNPNSKWTFKDGRNDGYRDYDEDGLRNKKEIELGTDLTLYDTDGDNIDDYEEVNGVQSKDKSKKYETNPLQADTDEDGLRDYVEIRLGLDPTNPITDGITLDGERRIYQDLDLLMIPKSLTGGTFPITNISSNISGLIEDGIRIKEYSDASFENNDLIIVKPLRIELKGDDDTVNISVDCSNYGDRVKKLMFVKYENNEITPVATKMTGNTISADLGNGEYGMIDVEMYLRKMNIYLGDYD